MSLLPAFQTVFILHQTRKIISVDRVEFEPPIPYASGFKPQDYSLKEIAILSFKVNGMNADTQYATTVDYNVHTYTNP